MFCADFKKVLLSPLFYICILIMEICALSSAWYEMEYTNDLLFLATDGWQSGNAMVSIAIPLLSGMAFAGSYCEERQSGYHYIAMVRGSRLRYCVSKVSVAILSGFFMVLAAGVLFLVVCLVLKRGDLVLAGESSRMMFADRWESVFLEKGYPVFAWLSWLLCYCVAASVWPALALCVSLFVRNRYVVMVSPFVAEQLWGTLVVGVRQTNQAVLYNIAAGDDGRTVFRLGYPAWRGCRDLSGRAGDLYLGRYERNAVKGDGGNG